MLQLCLISFTRIFVLSTNVISRLFGRFAHTRFPKSMQYAINRFYVDFFKINLNEFEKFRILSYAKRTFYTKAYKA